MFDEFLGLPLHPLMVHAAVVFVPLLALAAVVYALVPKLRPRVGWAAVALAVVAPITTVVARLSGDELRERLGYPLEGQIADHRSFGNLTMWITIGLGVLTLALVWTRARGGGGKAATWLGGALTVLVVIAAAAAVVYVFLAGDAGSRHVWEGVWESTS